MTAHGDALRAAVTAIDRATDTFTRWLHFDDPQVARDQILVVAGAYVANRLDGDPVWLLVVGPPSSGKTETIGALTGAEDMFPTSTLTEAALLSGVRAKEHASSAKGGLLREMGSFGILALKDFTSILAMRRDQRPEVLGALREIYDGSWTRRVGTDGGKELTWQGKVGLLAGCTPIIDTHHAVIAAMGDRFLMYRIPEGDPDAQASRALDNVGRQAEMRNELGHAMHELVRKWQVDPDRDPATDNAIKAGAALAAQGRTAIVRDGYTREIELIPQPEGTGRLTTALGQLAAGLRAIGADSDDTARIIGRVALDCIPEPRRTVLTRLAGCAGPQTIEAVAQLVGYPPQTVRRTLEDLAAVSLVHRTAAPAKNRPDVWSATTWTCQHLDALAFPRSTDPFTSSPFEGRTLREHSLDDPQETT